MNKNEKLKYDLTDLYNNLKDYIKLNIESNNIIYLLQNRLEKEIMNFKDSNFCSFLHNTKFINKITFGLNNQIKILFSSNNIHFCIYIYINNEIYLKFNNTAYDLNQFEEITKIINYSKSLDYSKLTDIKNKYDNLVTLSYEKYNKKEKEILNKYKIFNDYFMDKDLSNNIIRYIENMLNYNIKINDIFDTNNHNYDFRVGDLNFNNVDKIKVLDYDNYYLKLLFISNKSKYKIVKIINLLNAANSIFKFNIEKNLRISKLNKILNGI